MQQRVHSVPHYLHMVDRSIHKRDTVHHDNQDRHGAMGRLFIQPQGRRILRQEAQLGRPELQI